MMRLPIRRMKILGHSMIPAIPWGSLVLVNQWVYFFRKPRAGEIIVFKKDQLFCKRIVRAVPRVNVYYVAGDNLDAERIDLVDRKEIFGKVIRIFPLTAPQFSQKLDQPQETAQ